MTSSGVLHVYKLNNYPKKDSYGWKYDGNRKSYYSKKLLSLERRIKSLNLPWIVKDEEVYERVLSDEWDDDEANILSVGG